MYPVEQRRPLECFGIGETTIRAEDKRIRALSVRVFLTLAASFSLCALSLTLVVVTPLPYLALIIGAIGVTVFLSSLSIGAHLLAKRAHLRHFPKEQIKENISHRPPLGEPAKADLYLSNRVSHTLEMKKALIASATKSIECSFNYAGDEPFQGILDLIEQRMQEHEALRTHLILSRELLLKSDSLRIEELKRQFPNRFYALITTEIPSFRHGVPHTEANHIKLLVVDGKYFAIGGSGVTTKLTNEETAKKKVFPGEPFLNRVLDNATRDTDLFGRCNENQLTSSMRAEFFNLYQYMAWRMKRHLNAGEGEFFEVSKDGGLCEAFDRSDEIVKDASVSFFVSEPGMRKNPIESLYKAEFLAEEKTIHLASLRFNPSRRLKKAIKNSKAHKTAILNGDEGNKIHKVYTLSARPNYHLVNEVHEYHAKTLMHSKLGVFGRKIVIIGSFNLGTKSSKFDCEAVVRVVSPEIAEKAIQGLENDRVFSKKVFYKESKITSGSRKLVKTLSGVV